MLPLTPVSEAVLGAPSGWAAAIAEPFAAACDADPVCAHDGWATLVHAVRAAAAPEDADGGADDGGGGGGGWCASFDAIAELPDDAFSNDAAGGNGNSRANALLWAATRA